MSDLKINLFRMTHIENIPHILEYGITHISSANRNYNYKPIGDGGLIGTRNDFLMPNGKCLGDYTPFYFGVRMPMLYVIQKGFNGVKIIKPESIVYCISSIKKIINHNLEYVFTDGHAIDKITDFYYPKDVNEIETLIDRKAIDSKYWKDDNDLDLKRRKEAEFLVEGDIPISAVKGFVVYNNISKDILQKNGIQDKNIYVLPQCYF
jgi:hypothetical protein